MTGGGAVLDDLLARGLVHDSTDPARLRERLEAGPVTVYCGFDPTADSLHVGNLVPLLVLRRFQLAGHRAVALAGGATGMIGDPSGRSDERNLLDAETLDRNLAAISGQLSRLLDFAGVDGVPPAELVDNRTWTEPLGVLDFLRDVGKHITVNTMLAKESVRSRVESTSGISFTEFSYMLLQANDYAVLHASHGCELQVGGSDQWGNITAGIDLVRRRTGESVHGLTVPLVTRSDGAKFGKTAQGAVWLDPGRTLPYELHQYFINVDDRDVERFLLQLTLLPVDEVRTIVAAHAEDPAARVAQRRLADEVTGIVHGTPAVRRAALAGAVLFGQVEPDGEGLDALRGIVPETVLDASVLDGEEPIVDLLVASGLCSSRRDARQTIDAGAAWVNGRRLEPGRRGAVGAVDGRFVLLQKGRKHRHLVVLGAG
jgi:tyrosyl-tRNA synthetase